MRAVARARNYQTHYFIVFETHQRETFAFFCFQNDKIVCWIIIVALTVTPAFTLMCFTLEALKRQNQGKIIIKSAFLFSIFNMAI